MKDEEKTKEQLTNELKEMRQRVAELEASEIERKRMEEALRESEERFRDIAENTLEWIWEIDTDGKYTYAGSVVEKILGYKPEEVLKKHFYDLFHPEDRKELKKAAFEVFAKKQPFREFINRHVHKDGKTVWLSTSGVPILDEKGHLLGYRGADIDISERKQAEDKLKLFSHSIDSSNDGIAMGNTENRIIYVNETFSKMFGYSREELIGEEIAFLYSEDQIPKLEEALKATIEGGWSGELVGKTKDGELLPIIVTSSRVLDDEGKVIAHMTSHRDITERKQAEEKLKESEERYRGLFENSTDFVYTIDLKGNFTNVNQAAEYLTGYRKAELIGMNFRDYSSRDDHEKIFQAFHRIFKTGEPLQDYPLEVTVKDGTKKYFEASIGLFRRGEEIIGFQGCSRDITNRKRMEEALRKSEERLSQIIQGNSVPAFVIDKNHIITHWNKACVNLTGISANEVIGTQKQWSAFYPSERPVMADLMVDNVPEEGIKKYYGGKYRKSHLIEEAYEAEDFFSHLGEEGKWLFFTAAPLIDSEGKVIGAIETLQDITQRKEAEEALRMSEEKYRTILESIEDGYYEVDNAGNYTFFNNSLCKMIGYTRDELMGMNNRKTMDEENSKRLYQVSKEVYTTGKPARIADWEMIRKDATKRHMEGSISLIKDSKGKRIGFRGILRDITERKQAEAELIQTRNFLQNIYDSSIDGINTTDLHGNIIYASPRAKDILGYEQEEIIGKKVYSLYENRIEDAKLIMKELEEKGELRNHEMKLINKNSEFVDISLSASLLRNERGEVIGTLGIYRDITEKKQMEAELTAPLTVLLRLILKEISYLFHQKYWMI